MKADISKQNLVSPAWSAVVCPETLDGGHYFAQMFQFPQANPANYWRQALMEEPDCLTLAHGVSDDARRIDGGKTDSDLKYGTGH